MYIYFVKISSNGEILSKSMISEEDLSVQPIESGEQIITIEPEEFEAMSGDNFYYDNGIKRRPNSLITKVGEMSFHNIPTNLPLGVTMILENTRYPVTDDHVDLSIDTPGTYRVIFENFPYRNAIFKVVVP